MLIAQILFLVELEPSASALRTNYYTNKPVTIKARGNKLKFVASYFNRRSSDKMLTGADKLASLSVKGTQGTSEPNGTDIGSI